MLLLRLWCLEHVLKYLGFDIQQHRLGPYLTLNLHKGPTNKLNRNTHT
jgi:hypothetical protein